MKSARPVFNFLWSSSLLRVYTSLLNISEFINSLIESTKLLLIGLYSYTGQRIFICLTSGVGTFSGHSRIIVYVKRFYTKQFSILIIKHIKNEKCLNANSLGF